MTVIKPRQFLANELLAARILPRSGIVLFEQKLVGWIRGKAPWHPVADA